MFVTRVDVGRKKAGWCSLNESPPLWGPLFSLWEERLHILWAQQSQDPQHGRLFGGADWDSLAEAVSGGKKTEGGQAEGGASDLGTEHAQRSSPVLPSRGRATTVPGVLAQLLTLGPAPYTLEKSVAMSSMLQGVEQAHKGWCSRLHS